ncbi:MAG TPA: hypothetical protein VD694_00530 [Nitrososphaeraceae archaeon]|nr:hypothetical protein [Nitrososphaeraceae archaeon]
MEIDNTDAEPKMLAPWLVEQGLLPTQISEALDEAAAKSAIAWGL